MAGMDHYRTLVSVRHQLKHLITCPVCKEQMQEHNTLPKGLPCQHPVCENCLQQMQIGDELWGMFGTFGSNVRCPICRKRVTLGYQGVSGLPPCPWCHSIEDIIKQLNSATGENMEPAPLPPQPPPRLKCYFVIIMCVFVFPFILYTFAVNLPWLRMILQDLLEYSTLELSKIYDGLPPYNTTVIASLDLIEKTEGQTFGTAIVRSMHFAGQVGKEVLQVYRNVPLSFLWTWCYFF